MTLRWKIALIVLAAFIAAAALLLRNHVAEPRHQGRPVNVWLDDWAAHKQTDYRGAIREIGTNALPYAMRNLARNDSEWLKKYGELQPKLPGILQKIFPPPKPILQVVDGANVFYYIGSNSIPNAIALLKDESPSVRQSAAWGLSALRRQTIAANQAIPALIAALDDSDRQVRFYAMLAFEEMGPAATNAISALTKILADKGVGAQTNNIFYLRAASAVALGKIGPAAGSALPELKAALQETNYYLRGQAAVAIWRIDADAGTALPVLLKEMPGINEREKWDWIIALGEMGPRAKEAVPQLQVELKKDQANWVLTLVTNAFIKIDPEAAAVEFGTAGTNSRKN